jgi:hypothetical protein
MDLPDRFDGGESERLRAVDAAGGAALLVSWPRCAAFTRRTLERR